MSAPGEGSEHLPFQGRPLVSVIIPTRDRCELVQRAIDSVREQSYPNWEVIVVDDGSCDDTVETLTAMNDPRVRCISYSKSRGGGYARNLGAHEARGEYLAFLDSDDRWLPRKLERQLAVVENNGPGPVVVMGPPESFDGRHNTPLSQPGFTSGQRIADYVYGPKLSTVLSSCLLVEGRLGRRVRFDPDLLVNQDTDYLLRLERDGAKFLSIDEPLYVLDVRRRIDRIGLNPALCSRSYAWFRRVSEDWSPSARRGYLFWDYAMRLSQTGRRARGFAYLMRGFNISIAPARSLRQMLRVLGGGDVPAPIKRVWQTLTPWKRVALED